MSLLLIALRQKGGPACDWQQRLGLLPFAGGAVWQLACCLLLTPLEQGAFLES